MPNTYLPAQTYVDITLARLYERQRLTGLVTPFSAENFVGTKNDTVLYRTPGVTIARDYEWRTRTAPIIFDEIYRNELPIRFGNHMTVANRWTDEERTFDMTSVEREIADPMVDAMTRRFDGKVLSALLNADWQVTDLNLNAGDASLTASGKDARVTAGMRLKRKLDAVGTPANRYLILGANPLEWFVAAESVYKYDPAQALTVFRQLVVGRIAGFDIVDGTDIVGDNDIIAVHPSWAVLANAAPANPLDVSFSARRTFRGFSARIAAQYHLDWASDALLLNTFWGLSEIKDAYQRHTQASAAAANDGSEKGDIIIVDGRTQFTGKNVRGARGVFTPA